MLNLWVSAWATKDWKISPLKHLQLLIPEGGVSREWILICQICPGTFLTWTQPSGAGTGSPNPLLAKSWVGRFAFSWFWVCVPHFSRPKFKVITWEDSWSWVGGGLSWRAEFGGYEEPEIALLEWKMILGIDSSLHILQISMRSL